MVKRNAFLTFVFMALLASAADAATVTARSASRSSVARAPTMAAKVNKSDTTTATNSTTTPVVIQSVSTPATTNNTYVTETVDSGPIENKTTFFDTILDNASLTNTDAAASNLASLVRAQRAALDASSNATTTAVSTAKINACDAGLRSCMTDKCGKNFAKCSSDNDTIFGTKLDSCRRNLTCTANEFKLLSAEIKADRAQSIKLKAFNDILDCGNEYDQCILTQCGTTYSKCLGKRDGDTAISKCSSIANRCREMDNGLPNRAMSVFATLRQNAEKQIVSDENQLYTMRDNMRSICGRIGAMFDDRSLDCVYTVNFYAGEDSTLYASKKLYAGSTFDCTPNWFGIDVTTFMENAYRRTREQTAASSAMLGSGIGMAVGSLTSGAIDRAIDTKKAENALERAKCEQSGECVDDKPKEKEAKKQEKQKQKDNETRNTGIRKAPNADKDTVTTTAGVADNIFTGGDKNADDGISTVDETTEPVIVPPQDKTPHNSNDDNIHAKIPETLDNVRIPAPVAPIVDNNIGTNTPQQTQDEIFKQAKNKLLRKYCNRNPGTAVLTCGRKPELSHCYDTGNIDNSNKDADVKLVCSNPAAYLSQQSEQQTRSVVEPPVETTDVPKNITDIVASSPQEWRAMAAKYLQDKYCDGPANYPFACGTYLSPEPTVTCQGGKYKDGLTAESSKTDMEIACRMYNEWNIYAEQIGTNNMFRYNPNGNNNNQAQ